MLKRASLDLLFYLGIPLVVWNYFRVELGDYYAILFGMVPALIYTVISFVIKREWNVTGVFFMSIIGLNFLFNVLSHNAEQELWNGVYMAIISTAFYLITLAFKRPIGLYFFVDYSFAKGIPREQSFSLYRSAENYRHIVRFTWFLVLREVVVGSVKSFLILEKGIEGFNTIQLTSSVLGYAFTGMTIYYVVYIIKNLKKGSPQDA